MAFVNFKNKGEGKNTITGNNCVTFYSNSGQSMKVQILYQWRSFRIVLKGECTKVLKFLLLFSDSSMILGTAFWQLKIWWNFVSCNSELDEGQNKINRGLHRKVFGFLGDGLKGSETKGWSLWRTKISAEIWPLSYFKTSVVNQF